MARTRISEPRVVRAERSLARALSPRRIVMALLALPVIAAGVTVSVHVRTSPHAPVDALRDLVALAGCEAASVVGAAPAADGAPGYHAKYDTDGNGVTCDEVTVAELTRRPVQPSGGGDTPRMVGGAKFVRP